MALARIPSPGIRELEYGRDLQITKQMFDAIDQKRENIITMNC